MTRNTQLLTLSLVAACPAFAGTAPPPVGLHQRQWQAHRNTPTSSDLLTGRGVHLSPRQSSGPDSRPCSTVFGYLPYWVSSAHLQYERLTHLACFSVEANSDGTLGNDHEWPWTGVIDEAHAAGVKVILVVTLFDPEGIEALITNPEHVQTFFVNIKHKILDGNADGVNIDFEGGSNWQQHINAFMSDLTDYLHTEIPGSEVTIAGPAVNWNNTWDLPGLAASCDGIFIMGYNFYGSWSGTSGPNAPLTGGSINITDTVLGQYASVTQQNPEKLILGVPYYGQHWTTASSNARAEVVEWVNSPRFEDAHTGSESHGLNWDEQSQTPWYYWQEGSTWHQVWFDNDTSLGLKYDLASDNNLQGVGMWALGYDGARPELWDLLGTKFGACGLSDSDQDGVADDDDACPASAPGSKVDARGCACDQVDSDRDGVNDCDDTCPDTPAGLAVDDTGCEVQRLDSDTDGVSDQADACPATPAGETVDAAGCAASQRDGDRDGTPDDRDLCPGTPAGATTDASGCAEAERDDDGDGVSNGDDACPDTSSGLDVYVDGCAPSQLDRDGDGVADVADQCPNTPAGEAADAGGCTEAQRSQEQSESGANLLGQSGVGQGGGGSGGLCGAGMVPTLLVLTAVGVCRYRAT